MHPTRQAVVDCMWELVGVEGRTSECNEIFADAAPCYTERSASGKHWCGITALHALRSAGLTDALWEDRIGFVGPLLGWAAMTEDPRPGDVAYFTRHQHHAIVVEVTDDTLTIIAGNTGPTPGVVAVSVVERDRDDMTVFSIQGLIDKLDAADTDPPTPLPVRTLIKGCEGEDVRAWQRLLVEALGPQCLPRYGADAKFGTETESATIALQMQLAGEGMALSWGVVNEATRRLVKDG